MSIYNDLVRTSFPDASKERLDEIYSNSSDALSGILTGLESVGNLMFWATDNDHVITVKKWQLMIYGILATC
jgi:hypothetical protein